MDAHLRERTLEMVDDALGRCLAVNEIVDCTEFALALMPGPQGFVIVGILHVALKGPVLGTTIGNFDVLGDFGPISSQAFIDARVRACLESIRAQKAQILAGANGHGP